MIEIRDLLDRLGLGEYADAFTEADIDLDVLPDLTEDDLKELGLSLGHRRKLMAAIRKGLADAKSEAAENAAQEPVQSQRRQLTVMFCDLVGSTELANQFDPEDMSQILRDYQNACAVAVAKFDGYIDQILGDGVLAFFGYPHARENAAEFAVHAGLAILESMPNLRTPGDKSLQCRISIASGPVVINAVESASEQGRPVSGPVLNLAARLQEAAAPNGIIVDTSTYRLVEGLFELEALGMKNLKGIAEPVPSWSVTGERTAESRFEALHRKGIAPLVGREHELALLFERWNLAKGGEGQLALVAGEAGIGKSRLIQSLRENIARDDHVQIHYQCSPFHTNSALYPAISQLKHAGHITSDDDAETKITKLESVLEKSTEDLGTVVPLIASLMSIPTGSRYPALSMSIEEQKRRTKEVLVDQLCGLARHGPVMMLVEDAHWMDPSTEDLVSACIDRIEGLPIFMVVTFRPEFEHAWDGSPNALTMPLSRLPRQHTSSLIRSITGGKSLPTEVVEQILVKTDGIPLFVEELTKTIVESGLLREEDDRYILEGALPTLAVPTTLQDALQARLDRLASVKEVAQIGAVIGREFSSEIVAATADLSHSVLEEALSQLVQAQLLQQRRNAVYAFKHALVQDAAYGTLLKSRRQELHERCAEVLKSRFPEIAETTPELLAHHYTRAGRAEEAIENWLKAGQRAAERSANVEAISHFKQALDLIETVGDPTQRARFELKIRIGLGMPLIAIKGYAAEETGATWQRARDLATELGDREQLVRALYGLWAYQCSRGQNRTALETANELLNLGGELNDDGVQLVGRRIRGLILHTLGDQEGGRASIEAALESYDAERHGPLAFRFGQDQRAAGLAFLSLILWLQGFPDQAMKLSRMSVGEACELDHANSVGYSLAYGGCIVAKLCGDIPELDRLTTTLLDYSERHSLSLWRAYGLAFHGSVLFERGDQASAIEELGDALEGFQRAGSGLQEPAHRSTLALALSRNGQTDEALELIDDIVQQVERRDEGWCLPEMLRIKGEFLLESGSANAAAEAEALFLRALDLSREQQARSWELRVASSFARLRLSQGRKPEALETLFPVYSWFTEGFDTEDLKSAKELIGTLEHRGAAERKKVGTLS